MLLRIFTLLIIVFSIAFTSLAQTLRFKVIHSTNLKGIDHVSIKDNKGVIYSDENGLFSLKYVNHDTLTLSKENYHTIYYLIEAKNFDAAHTISLSMSAATPSTSTGSSINNLQKFEYHFVHDQEPENNYLKIHALEHTPSVEARNQNPQAFKIGAIPLEHTTVEKHTTPEVDSDYKLKK